MNIIVLELSFEQLTILFH